MSSTEDIWTDIFFHHPSSIGLLCDPSQKQLQIQAPILSGCYLHYLHGKWEQSIWRNNQPRRVKEEDIEQEGEIFYFLYIQL